MTNDRQNNYSGLRQFKSTPSNKKLDNCMPILQITNFLITLRLQWSVKPLSLNNFHNNHNYPLCFSNSPIYLWNVLWVETVRRASMTGTVLKYFLNPFIKYVPQYLINVKTQNISRVSKGTRVFGEMKMRSNNVMILFKINLCADIGSRGTIWNF